MEIAVEIRSGGPVLVFSKRLDDEAAPRFESELAAWIQRMQAKGLTRLVLDFAGVTFVTSTILRSLLSTAKRVKKKGGHLVIANPSAEVEATFRIIDFTEVLERSGVVFERGEAEPGSLAEPVSAGVARLDLFVGGEAIPCKDGDTLGTQGSITPELFADLPGVAPVHARFRLLNDAWHLECPDDEQVLLYLDGQLIPRGERVALKDEHALQIADVRLRFRVTAAEAVHEEGEPVEEQVKTMLSKTAEWFERTLLDSNKPNQ
jgi:anti-anti-sigma factor